MQTSATTAGRRARVSTVAKRIRECLVRDDGATLPETIIAVVVSATMMGAISTGVIALTTLNHSVAATAASIRDVTTTDMRWRESVRQAVQITPADDHTVTMTVPAATGCRTDSWTFDRASGLRVATTVYPTLTGTSCAGTALAPAATETLLPGNSGVSFHYRNLGGRDVTYTAGSPTLAPGTAPAEVASTGWTSTTVGSAYLDGTVITPGRAQGRLIHSSQIANNIVGP
ncbi:hypothetical protein [Leifsonia sp. fls2-241-R2A-40a]|uniref:hypothetical protein n=1 Tax=Leifsonia sp. fls2-241-R2A-40a TaxID=3040290 RepID=UPI00254E6CE8|nr:hypothetical protein [Leifsonia sp. fls2-241-R2A-40a]